MKFEEKPLEFTPDFDFDVQIDSYLEIIKKIGHDKFKKMSILRDLEKIVDKHSSKTEEPKNKKTPKQFRY